MQVLVVDEFDMIGAGIAAYLAAAMPSKTVHACGYVQAQIVLEEQDFDLVLVDFDLPETEGSNSLSTLMRRAPQTKFLALSRSNLEPRAQAAIDAGAAGFVSKRMPPQTLIEAVRHIDQGGIYMPQHLMDSEARSLGPLALLTERELAVLHGLCAGKSNKEIGRDLQLQEVTVKLHGKTLSKKLAARNRTHAALIGRDCGIDESYA